MKAFPETWPDEEIIRQVLDGNPALFEILIRRNNSFLYKTGRSYHYNHEDTQDLMQDTFIDAYCNLSKFENRSSFKTWIIRIMLHNCYRKRQKFSYKNEIVIEMKDDVIPAFSAKRQMDTVQAILNRELGTVVENALQRIPTDYSMVFSLREISGLNVEETAKVLDISQSNVKVRLSRAKVMLRKEMEQCYTAEELFEFNLMYCDAMVDRVMNGIKALKSEAF